MAINPIAHWREVGQWWLSEPTREIIRYRDAKDIVREKSRELPTVFRPQDMPTPVPPPENHGEDWSLRMRRSRDEKVFGRMDPLVFTGSVAKSTYVPLHVVSGFSFGRGLMLPEEIVQCALAAGLPAVALTDLFSFAGAFELQKAAATAGIKPIIGATFTLETGGEIVLLAQNAQGYRNISHLISKCHLTEPRQFPLLRWANLNRMSDVICLTGGHLGPLLPIILKRDFSGAKQLTENLIEIFGKPNVAIEIERSFMPFEIRANENLLDLAESLGVTAVAGGIVTHAQPSHFPVQDVITCAHTLCGIDEIWGRKPHQHESQPERLRTPERALNAERYLRPADEMQELFRDRPDLLANTLHLADRIDAKVMPGRTVLPKLYENPNEALINIVESGAHERYPSMPQKLRKRIRFELDRITRLGFTEHFLTAWDMCAWAEGQGISFSGRGSVVDSVVAYCLGFSRIDAFRHNLHFDRFLPEDGSKRPDIDIDFPAARRNDVRGYLTNKYGKDNVATVAAFGAIAHAELSEKLERYLEYLPRQ